MSFSGTSVAQAIADLKEYYSSEQVLNLTLFKKNPLLGLCSKEPDFAGEWYPVPIQSSSSAGVSSQFQTAQNNQTSSVYKKFMVPVAPFYGLASVSNQAMLASRNNEGAFKNLLKAETDAQMQNVTNLISAYMYRDGTGTLATISGISSGAITTTVVTDPQFFWPGLQLSASATPGATPRSGTGYVLSVDPTQGTILVSTTQGGSPGTPSGWSDGDSIQIAGTFNNVFNGLTSWLPYTSATRPGPNQSQSVNTLFGVDRSSDPSAFAGTWYNGASQSQMEGLLDGLSVIEANRGTPDIILMSPASMRALVKDITGKREYVDVMGPTGVGFKALEIEGESGPVRIIADRNCVPQQAFALDLSMVKMISYDQAPTILTYEDGIEAFRVSNQDAVEVRVGAYLNTLIEKPVSCGVITLQN